MLSLDENERMTSVGAGTPMGEVMRRYWLRSWKLASWLTRTGSRYG